MQISSFLTTLLLASFLQISFAFTCSDLSENQCNQLQSDGCFWAGPICRGSFSPKCVPPSCYYIDSNYQGIDTPDGSPGKPLKTLSDGLTKISGKDGFLIIVNIMENATVAMTKTSTISSNITIKPLFENKLYTIDFTQYLSLFTTYLTIKSSSLKLIRANLGLQYSGSGADTIFAVSAGGRLYFENVEVHNAPNSSLYTIVLVKTTNSTFSMENCKFTDNRVSFVSSSGSTILWKNVYGSGKNYLMNGLTNIKTMIMKDCFFTDVLGGPFVSAISGGEILLQNCTFKNLTSSPTFTVNSVVKLTMEDCIFDQILVKSVKMLIFQRAQDLYGVPSVIKNTSFTNIVVQSLLIYLEGKTVSLSLINVTMKNITQQDLIATDSLLISPLDFPRGVCCSTTRNAQLFVESSNFSNIFSHCFGNRDTNFTIKSSIFDNSQLSFRESEAEIKREEVSSLDDNSGVSWIYIEGTSYFNGKIYQILIQNVKFLQNGILAKYGGAIRYTGSIFSQITVTGSEFIGNKAYYGGAISTENIRVTILELENNIFVGNSAYHGGAIYKIDKSSLDTFSNTSVSITNNQFIGNKATKNGGALYLYRDSIWILDTEFISNLATNGGALYYINLDGTENKKYEGMNNVTFIQNSASNVGGALKLFFKYSKLKIDAMTFENNFDINQQVIHEGRPSYYLLSFYDIIINEQIGRFDNLQDFVKNPEETRLSFIVNTSESTAELAEIKHKSGNELAQILHVQVFDNENKVANYIHDEEITIEMVASENLISNYSASLVSSLVKFKVSNGICVFMYPSMNLQGQFFAKSAVKMHGEPKTTATLQMKNVEGFSDFIQDSNMIKSFDLQVHFIDCEEGDIFDHHTRSCLTCAAGSYSFQNPYKKASHCHQCPAQIDCYGGNQVGPKSGYWMESPTSLVAFQCPNPDACLGGYVDYEYFPNGKCLYPHQGNLCNQCAPKFAKFGSSKKCEDCKNNAKYYLKFGLFILLQIAVILGLHEFNKRQGEKNIFYVNILKILINFVQINSIIFNYDLEWSPLSKSFLHVTNSFIPSNHDSFPIDCLLSLILSDNQNLNYAKLIVTFFQPFLIWGLSILSYLLTLLSLSSKRKDIKKKIHSALGRLFIISAFLVQPNIILTCLELFSCQNLSSPGDPKYFLTSNSEVQCWTGSHVILSFGVALPLLLVWAILLPLILFFNTRKNLKESSWQPFFYQGLEKDKSYWEFLMLFVKTLVIILFTIFNIIQIKAQVISTFFVCISLMVLFLRFRPFSDPSLHLLGLLSFASLTLLSYISFFSLIDNWMDTQMRICSVFLIIVNCAVFLLPAFYLIKGYIKTKRGENPAIQKAQAVKLPVEEQRPESEKVMIKSEANEDCPEICGELNQEMKIGKIINHAQKDSIDNFSIMQSSGLGLLSPHQMTPLSSSRLLSPLSAKQLLLPSTPKDNSTIEKGDFLQKTLTQKKIQSKRINLKQFVTDELDLKSRETEQVISEVIRTEMTVSAPSARTQGDNELDNFLDILKDKKVISKNNEEEIPVNM